MAGAREALEDAGTAEEVRFAFGRNWSRFAEGVGAKHLAEAERGLSRLLDPAIIRGAEVLDIGCGSGLHAIAFQKLGAARVVGIDIDPDSVGTARRLARRFEAAGSCRFETVSVFDLAPERQERFDVVYSWGVLHHTGAMWKAIATAAAMVRENGHLAIAIYKRTFFFLQALALGEAAVRELRAGRAGGAPPGLPGGVRPRAPALGAQPPPARRELQEEAGHGGRDRRGRLARRLPLRIGDAGAGGALFGPARLRADPAFGRPATAARRSLRQRLLPVPLPTRTRDRVDRPHARAGR